MKKIMLILAVCVALTACKKEELAKGTSFKKGQKVTFTVNNGCDSNDKAHGYNHRYTGSGFYFEWYDDGEFRDSILVTVNGKSSIFTLKEGGGTPNGTFEGIMPADGTEFDIQHPVKDPNLSDQSWYNSDQVFNTMKFTAKNCTLNSTPTLQMEYGIVAIPLVISSGSADVVEVRLTIGGKSYYAQEEEVTLDYHPTHPNTNTIYFVVEPFSSSTVTLSIADQIGGTPFVVKTASGMSCGKGNMLTMGDVDVAH